MRTIRRPQLQRLVSRRRNGQSIPIIALMVVVLVAMIGLSVDVGNTFSHERKAVSASNAAAVAAMTRYLQHTTNAITDGDVYKSIKDTLTANGLTPGDGSNNTVQVTVYYLNSQGKTLDAHPDQLVEGSGQTAPSGASFIQIKLNGTVDTSFARVVGRNDLPINASAYATTCTMNSGVYPIGIDDQYIDFASNQFNTSGLNIVAATGKPSTSEWSLLATGDYRGRTQRRLYVKDTAPSGNFGWLRWLEGAKSATDLGASLTGVGNAAAGYEEAPWPSGYAGKPPDYPINPGVVDVGDWIWAKTGVVNGSSVDAAIQTHMNNGTRMIMPIYRHESFQGTGVNAQARIAALGVFVIVGQGNETSNNASSKGFYFDMVYLGDPSNQLSACLATAPPAANDNLELVGGVSFYPEYAIIPDNRDPVQYIVVLDTSGSMSANFDGKCNNNGLQQCANGPVPVTTTGTGTGIYWNPQEERRIYVAKKALESLVNQTYMPGNSTYVNTRPSDQMAVVWFTDSVSASQTKAFSSDPAALKTFITNSNKVYFGNGGTNGAAALYRASLMYRLPTPTTVVFNGKTYTYKRVVVFVTDGVSNNFLDTNASNLSGGQSNDVTYPTGSLCRGLGSKVIESASCQTTDGAGGSMWKGWNRPITQMIDTSGNYLRNALNTQVFVIALSDIPSTGLDGGVSSDSTYFYSAKSLRTNPDGSTNVDDIIDIISTKVNNGNCVPGPNGTPTNMMTSGQFVATGSFVYPTVGQVDIYNSTTPTISAPIKAASDGTLSYYFSSVPAGTYTMEAWLYYYDSHDRTTRKYGMFWAQGAPSSITTVDVNATTQTTSFSQRVDKQLTLKLSGQVCTP
ncbi:MAG: vWA domain-containing protein [Chloroflexales bacterium]